MQELIGQAKQSLVMSKERFLKTFSFVPDDKLNWSPSATAKSALRIAAHVGFSNEGMASVIRGEKFPFASMKEMFEAQDGREKTITTREQAIKQIEDGTNTALAALDILTPERLTADAGLPMPLPMAAFIMILSLHVSNHSAQVDYLQTIWGDLDNHF